MREGHIYNTVILNLAPTGPLYGSQPDDPPFFSERWWAILRRVLERGRSRGMRVWLYDQLGFSTARIQERLMEREPAWRAQELRVVEQDVQGPITVRMHAPGRAVAACAVRLNTEGRPEPPIAHISSSLTAGHLQKQLPEGRWRVMLFYETPGGFDYMSRWAAGKLLNFVHGEFERKLGKYLGSTIPGTFQDELPPMNRWTRRFLEEFRKRKGYDLRPYLPMLWYDLGPKTAMVRCHVADVRSTLLEEAFFKPLYEWHQRHGMICSYDQMTRDADPIEGSRMYGDYMRTMRWFQAPGNDQTGLSRPHSSLAHLYRRPRVWLEGFYNSGWGQTLEELSQRIHEFYAQGSNLYNPHAWYYTTLGGWWEWAPPCTSFRQPYWRHYPLFADYVTRLSYALSRGSHVCDIAVLYPSPTVHAGGTYAGTYDSRARRGRDTYRDVCSHLEALGVDYDILDEASLLRANVQKGRLQIADEGYRCVILPSVTTLPRSGMANLSRLSTSGGIVAAVGSLPSASPEVGDGDSVIQSSVAQMFGTAQATSADGVVVRRGVLYSRQDAAALLHAVVDRLPKHADGVERYIHRRIAGADLYFLLDGTAPRKRVVLRGSGTAKVLLPWTGRILSAATAPMGTTHTAVTLNFTESRGLFVLLGSPSAAPAPTPAPVRRAPPGTPVPASAVSATDSRKSPTGTPFVLTLPNEWASKLIDTLDNRWGDFALPPSPGAPAPECRRFLYREERSAADGIEAGWHLPTVPQEGWQGVTATFGTYWWITRPDVGERNLKLPGPDDGDWRPDPAVWQPAVFSLKYGIEKNPVYSEWLGPKGRVPDEYLDFGRAPAGTVRFATTFVHVDQPCDVRIRCGQGDARVAVNGRWLPADKPLVAHLLTGYNALTVQVRHPASGILRTYVHVGPADDGAEAPMWIWSAQRGDVSDAYVRKTFTLDEVPRQAVLSITADNGYEVFVNGVRVGRDVGSGTEVWSKAERYSVVRQLRRGKNVIAVHGMNLGGPAGLIAILSWPERPVRERGWRRLVTDDTWRVTTTRPRGDIVWTALNFDDRSWPQATVVGRYPCEPWGIVAGLRRAEPAILPESGWLNREVLPWVQGLILDPRPGIAKPVGWYRFRTPPGCTAMWLPIVGRHRVFVEGRECGVAEDGWCDIPADLQGPSLAVAIRVEQAAGRYEGAAFRAPVRFQVDAGTIRLGNWADQGLPQYSGGVQYAQTFELPASIAGSSAWLDLGRVRGTAEVTVNGKTAGVRVWRPYTFDLTGLLRSGSNRLEITVYNTLGPYFGAGYPTPYVYPGQEVSGLFGPVRILSGEPPAPPAVDLTGLVNVALASRGASARASSEHPSGLYPADSILAGYTAGDRWARGGGWNDATEGQFPDWVEVVLPRPVTIMAVRLITLQPAPQYGIRDFEIMGQKGGDWVRLAEIRDNDEAIVTFGVPAIRTDRVRVVVHGSNDDAYSRIIAVQVFAPDKELEGSP